jgi:Protein of unknown function (DUF2384)
MARRNGSIPKRARLWKSSKGKLGAAEVSKLLRQLELSRQQVTPLLQRVESVLADASLRTETLPRPSPLDHIDEVISVTAELRVANGNLSAVRAAKLYGVSLSQLAEWIGRSRQAVAKTPDADSLQESLDFFERVARLTAIMPADSFRKWLRMPNKLLDGKRPLESMASKDGQIVADLVDDMLTGAPS